MDKVAYDANDTIMVSVDVENTEDHAGAEIVEVYITKILQGKQRDNKPKRQLKGFTKVWLEAGEKKTVMIEITLSEVTFWSNLKKRMVVELGIYRVAVGASSANLPCSTDITVSGEWNAKLFNVYAIAKKYVMKIGEQSQIQASAIKENAEHLCMGQYRPIYTSSDEMVTIVNENGLITAKAFGTALITVSVTCEGVTKTTKVPVAVKM